MVVVMVAVTEAGRAAARAAATEEETAAATEVEMAEVVTAVERGAAEMEVQHTLQTWSSMATWPHQRLATTVTPGGMRSKIKELRASARGVLPSTHFKTLLQSQRLPLPKRS